MDFIIELYSKLLDKEKVIFKEILNDIIFALSEIKRNKWKVSIKQEKQKEILKKSINILEKVLKKEWITENELNNINEKELLEDLFWISNFEKYNKLLFPIYKWCISSKNDSLFTYRRDFINMLNQYNIIKISSFNIVREFNLIKKWKIEDWLEDFYEYYNNIEQNLRNEYWDDIIDKDLKKTDNAERKLELIYFKKEVIEGLLNRINQIDSSNFEFRNKALFYKWKIIYTPKQYWDRILFLDLLFSEKKWTYFKLNIIYNYIEWWWSDLSYLSEAQSKKIYNIKDKINNIIFFKTWVKKTFSLWKWDDISKICRSY